MADVSLPSMGLNDLVLGSAGGLPLGMPPMTQGRGRMGLGNDTLMEQYAYGAVNMTLILGAVRNMTMGQAVASLQAFVLSALMRQYMFNDFFAGGLGLMLMGLLGRQLQRAWSWALGKVMAGGRGPVEVRIPHDSEAFPWLQDWLQKRCAVSSSRYDIHCSWDRSDCAQMDEDEDRPCVSFIPELHRAQQIEFKGQTVWVKSEAKMGPLQENSGGDNGALLSLFRPRVAEDLVLSAGNKEVLSEMVKEAQEEYYRRRSEHRTTMVHRWDCRSMYWESVTSQKVRSVSSVVLDADPQGLLDDARRFLANAEWYADRGVPHRRGYLLYGPPGCGKTSLIKAMAGELKMDVSLISLSSSELSDDVLHSALSQLPHNSIFVLEDVDAAFGRTRHASSLDCASDAGTGPGEVAARTGNNGNSLSFSGLLNALDGIIAREGHIVVMTTNHIEKLDPALIRPGRVDQRLFLGLASSSQACRIFRRFFPEASAEQEECVGSAIPSGELSPASLQGLFLEHRDNLQGLLSHIPAWVEEQQGTRSSIPDEPATALASDISTEALVPVTPPRLSGLVGKLKRRLRKGPRSEMGDMDST